VKVFYGVRYTDWKIEDKGMVNHYALMADDYIKVFWPGEFIPGYLRDMKWAVAHPIHYYELIKLILRGRVR